MGRNSLHFLLVLLFLVSANTLFAQRTVSGVVKDASNKDVLIGASVVIKGTATGTVTDIDGKFLLSVPDGKQTLVVSFIGYEASEIIAAKNSTDLGTVELGSDAVGLAEVSIIASVAIDRKTPIAVSTVSPIFIEEKLGTQEFPEILKSTPSVYATKQGGGYGDSRINIRGFNQRNVAVMINGVPVNDMENGWVYWSNWAGLADVTRSMQVQRGLSASKIAIPSVGGTINILTKTTDVSEGGKVKMGIGNNGYRKTGITLSTGLKNGWAMTFAGDYSEGDGWSEALWHKSYSYYANISKQVNDNHLISFSVFGAPQRHGQRSTKMTISEWELADAGIRYNKDWGYRNGQLLNIRENFYHKPQAILNHFWTISDKTSLSTALYASVGIGGGTGAYGSASGSLYASDINGDDRISQLVNIDKAVAINQALGNKGSSAILRSSNNNHNWYGLLSTLNHKISEKITFQVGLDARYYKGEHYREVVDLLGGRFIIDNSDKNEPNKVARVGDKIGYYNDGLVKWLGVFGQAEYSSGPLSAYVNLAASNKQYKRVDYFSKAPGDQQTDWFGFMGYSTKGGLNYNINSNHNIFANAGYFQNQPDFDAVFLNNSNDKTNENAKNEQVISFELGYGYRASWGTIKVNAYRTSWNDKSFTKRINVENVGEFSANILGVDALHQGIELETSFNLTKSLSVNLMGSLGDWRWANDLKKAEVFNDNNEPIGTVDIYIKDVHVGDAAQKTAAIAIDYKLDNGVKIGLDYNYFGNLYSSFDPLSRTTAPKDGALNPDSWKMPEYSTIDLNASYKFKLGSFDATASAKVNNLLDVKYISDADDGGEHDWNTSYVFYGTGRTWSGTLSFNF